MGLTIDNGFHLLGASLPIIVRLDEAACSRTFGITRPTAPLSPPELSFLTVGSPRFQALNKDQPTHS